MKKGFTVLEMILVLTVISIVVLVTVPNITQKKRVINQVGCRALIEVVNAQILMYDLDNGYKPDSISDLVDGEYISPSQCYCPDGTPVYISDGEAFAD